MVGSGRVRHRCTHPPCPWWDSSSLVVHSPRLLQIFAIFHYFISMSNRNIDAALSRITSCFIIDTALNQDNPLSRIQPSDALSHISQPRGHEFGPRPYWFQHSLRPLSAPMYLWTLTDRDRHRRNSSQHRYTQRFKFDHIWYHRYATLKFPDCFTQFFSHIDLATSQQSLSCVAGRNYYTSIDFPLFYLCLLSSNQKCQST